MSPVVSPYDPLPTINSALLRNPPDAVPPTDELESLHAELKLLRERTLERAKKAGEDLKIIEESMRRMKEKEKGKAKALEKVKKERGCTCSYRYVRATLLLFAFVFVLGQCSSPATHAPSRVFTRYFLPATNVICPTSDYEHDPFACNIVTCTCAVRGALVSPPALESGLVLCCPSRWYGLDNPPLLLWCSAMHCATLSSGSHATPKRRRCA